MEQNCTLRYHRLLAWMKNKSRGQNQPSIWLNLQLYSWQVSSTQYYHRYIKQYSKHNDWRFFELCTEKSYRNLSFQFLFRTSTNLKCKYVKHFKFRYQTKTSLSYILVSRFSFLFFQIMFKKVIWCLATFDQVLNWFTSYYIL